MFAVVIAVCLSCFCLQNYCVTAFSPLKSAARQRTATSRPVLRLNDVTTVTDVATSTDPEFLSDTFTATVNAFTSSLSAKIIGALIGNLIAGVVFKIISDVIAGAKQSGTDLVEKELPKAAASISSQAWLKLLACLAIDLIGDSSFILPGVGELEDLAWAPIGAFALKYLFGSNIIASMEFAKEVLPFTDIIPLATTIWMLENVFVDSPLSRLLLDKKPTSMKEDN